MNHTRETIIADAKEMQKVVKTLQERKSDLEIDQKAALDDLKGTMLALSPDISCHACKEAFCCRGQKKIEISSSEFDNISELITQEHKNRARHQIKMKKTTGLYTCPFNDPITGKCEIYDSRFVVCAQYGVLNKIEHCDSSTKHGLEVINPMLVMTKVREENTVGLLMFAAQGEPIDLLDKFESWLKE